MDREYFLNWILNFANDSKCHQGSYAATKDFPDPAGPQQKVMSFSIMDIMYSFWFGVLGSRYLDT